MSDRTLENLLQEDRVFPPSPEFVAQANAGSEIYKEAEDWRGWWLEQARRHITWYREPHETVDESNAPFYRWFADGRLNLAYNCLDRHLDTIGDKVAYHWIGEPGDTRDLTFTELHADVGRFANGHSSLGVATSVYWFTTSGDAWCALWSTRSCRPATTRSTGRGWTI